MWKYVYGSWGRGQTFIEVSYCFGIFIIFQDLGSSHWEKDDIRAWEFSDIHIRGPQILMGASLLELIFTSWQWVQFALAWMNQSSLVFSENQTLLLIVPLRAVLVLPLILATILILRNHTIGSWWGLFLRWSGLQTKIIQEVLSFLCFVGHSNENLRTNEAIHICQRKSSPWC